MKKLRIFLIAGEASGDQLGAGLVRALRAVRPSIEFSGIGGPAMASAGLTSLFPLEDLAVMGFLPVLRHLPRLLARIEAAVEAVSRQNPDALVIIDSPDFTHRVARRVRRALPDLPIIDYVSPSVWAWRSGRARKMRRYVDHVLAVLPFEPAVHRRLGGPCCSYVGHPLSERFAELAPTAEDLRRREEKPPLVVVLPGSRRGEITRLMPVFAATLPLVAERIGRFDTVLPAVPHLEAEIRARLADWPMKPRLVSGDAEKFAAFRAARAALAASGTVTLELALAAVPMVVAYRVAAVETLVRPFIRVPSIVLPNLVLGEPVVPEFLQERCVPAALAAALVETIEAGPAREAQAAVFPAILERLRLPTGETPSSRAAKIVLGAIERGAVPAK